MKGKEPRPVALISQFFLTNSSLIKIFSKRLFSKYDLDEEVKEAVYLAYHQAFPLYPDHVFQGQWTIFCKMYQNFQGHWLVPSLKALADYFLVFEHGRLHAKLSRFGEWQNIVARIDCMPIRAGAYVWGIRSNDGVRLNPPLRKANVIESSEFLVRPWDPAVEDYIASEGLHETHVHLNGSTQVALCWQYAIRNPEAELSSFSRAFHSPTAMGVRVRELCRSVDSELSPTVLIDSLKTAGDLRSWLIHWMDAPDSKCPADLNTLRAMGLAAPAWINARFSTAERSSRSAEWEWITRILHVLRSNPNRAVETMLHLYFLIFNRFRQLLVQRVDMVGFDQFQKYTYTELRETSEAEYFDRFCQMHGNLADSRQSWVEGRLAPKSSLEKNYDLFSRVLGGYFNYLIRTKVSSYAKVKSRGTLAEILNDLEEVSCENNKSRKVKLALVMHFIKLEPKACDSYTHSSLRKSLSEQADVLAATLHRWPKLRNWVRGIDAAANELHATPEIFAPIFRFCARIGLTHRTYHAGEDFLHLLGGIRHISDAMEFLDLRNGDRLGHCTAIGIMPYLWVDRMPAQVVVKKGDWLLDLLTAWQRLRDNATFAATATRLVRALEELASFIFGEFCSANELERTMALRGLMPQYVFAALDEGIHWNWRSASFNDSWREEAKLVAEVLNNRRHLSLLRTWWQDPDVISRATQSIPVATDFLSESELLALQQAVLHSVRERQVIIETLPTSNVRIAPYNSFAEHHSLRWMKIPGFVVKDDPDVMISLGSDDPGIFCNDLSTDFYQLYAVMRDKGLSDVEAISFLARPNERGRQYRFHSSPVLRSEHF